MKCPTTMLTLTSQTSKTSVNSVDHSLGSEELIPSDARVAARVKVQRLWYDHKVILETPVKGPQEAQKKTEKDL